MPKLLSIDDQRYAVLTLQSLRVTIGPLQASTTSLESQESYFTAGMLPYNRNVTLQTFLSSTRDFYRLHSTFARLYNAAASPASRLRSAGSLAIICERFHGCHDSSQSFKIILKRNTHKKKIEKLRGKQGRSRAFISSIGGKENGLC